MDSTALKKLDRVAVSTDERCLMLRPEDETGVMGLTMKFRSEA